jgi:hypothetical protein
MQHGFNRAVAARLCATELTQRAALAQSPRIHRNRHTWMKTGTLTAPSR